MPKDTRPRVKIINPEHPHANETGRWTGEVIYVLGKPMGKVELENCPHMTDACFVVREDIREIMKKEPR